ncbi:hypothetical protein JIN85_13235 [Luteolibacter pohnpeiensis]|uniref:Uncharacterized protein n=1 Tax=Luteolibacter pohnpeiensis TaxID=454153 RepID=A0A934SDT3_9BACT|nr:hypothetical protein [Luteolibacter pohnpeiensis]MBK1883383.1 hypothetical protein [Luteolibacter pohnpeiensis]
MDQKSIESDKNQVADAFSGSPNRLLKLFSADLRHFHDQQAMRECHPNWGKSAD